MRGHVNSMICSPELAGVRCGEEAASEHHAVRLGPKGVRGDWRCATFLIPVVLGEQKS